MFTVPCIPIFMQIEWLYVMDKPGWGRDAKQTGLDVWIESYISSLYPKRSMVRCCLGLVMFGIWILIPI